MGKHSQPVFLLPAFGFDDKIPDRPAAFYREWTAVVLFGITGNCFVFSCNIKRFPGRIFSYHRKFEFSNTLRDKKQGRFWLDSGGGCPLHNLQYVDGVKK